MKRTNLIFCLVLSSLIYFFTESTAAIINVPSQFTAIQSAINSSSNADTILVQPGTYFENINFRGKKIVLTSLYYQNNDLSYIQTTIINGSNPVFPDSASCVIINNHEDSTTVLQGFTITGGSGTKWQDEYGAGLYREGGGILVQYSSPVIQFNIITGNNAIAGGGVNSTGGGGIRIGDSYVRFYNNVVMNNSARYGAGIVLNYTGGEYKNNLICRNFGSTDFGAGSGIWLNGSFNRAILIENNTIVSNSSLTEIPGVRSNGAQATLRNNIIWRNYGGSVFQISGGFLVVRYCDVQGGYTGAGNININPEFDSTNYYLKSTSPVIDKGDSSLIYNDPESAVNPGQALWPARGTVRNDPGAYGGPLSSMISNTVVSVVNLNSVNNPYGFELYQNYPNPFNPSTNLGFVVSESGYVSLKVYNMLGKEIATPVNENLKPGKYNVKWDASGFTSGIYYYTLKSGDNSETKKMLLIK